MQLSCHAKAPVATNNSTKKGMAGNVRAVRPATRPAVRCVAIAQVSENRKGGLAGAGMPVPIMCVS
jgi:predicted protein tyrosine phosphatase